MSGVSLVFSDLHVRCLEQLRQVDLFLLWQPLEESLEVVLLLNRWLLASETTGLDLFLILDVQVGVRRDVLQTGLARIVWCRVERLRLEEGSVAD